MTQSSPSATLTDLFTAAVASYGGPNAPAMGPQWTDITAKVTSDPVLAKTMADAGFSGEVYINGHTGEVLISDRGTIGNVQNIISDANIAVTASNGAQSVADNFATAALAAAQEQLSLLGVTVSAVYTTGHSLGGGESQGQSAMLSVATDPDGTPLLPTGVKITNVSLDAPGVAGLSTTGNSSNYTSYDFSAQGDLVHLAGGSNLAGTTSVSLAVGPSMWATGGLIGLGTAMQAVPGAGTAVGAASIADGLSNALDAHSSAALLKGILGTALGNTQMSQLQGMSAVQMQNLMGISQPTSSTPVYDAAGYDQNGYSNSGYNIYGVDKNGNLDPSIATQGGRTNTDTLSDGSKVTVVIGKDGSATETLNDADGTVYTYSRNAAGVLIGSTTQTSDGTLVTQTIDPTTGIITQSEASGSGAIEESGTIQKNQDGTANAISTIYNSSGQKSISESDQKASNGTSTETDVNYSNNVAQGQVVINDSATEQVTNASVTGTGAAAYLNNAIVNLAAGAQATINGTGNIYSGGAGSSLTTSESDGTTLTMSASTNGGAMTVQEVNTSAGVNQQQVLTGNDFNIKTSIGTQSNGEKDIYLTTSDGSGLNNGQDKLVEAGYNTAGKQVVQFDEQTNGTNAEMFTNANNTTTVKEFGNNADGTVNWTALTSTQTLQGAATDVQASITAQSSGEKDVYLTTNDGQALNNGQDKLVEAGYDTTGKQIIQFNEQTNGMNAEMFSNTNGTTTVKEFGDNSDGTVNWNALTGAQTLQGTATDVQATIGTQANGEKDVYLTTNDGQGLNNGLDKLVETGYDPSTGKQNLAFNEQTNGTNVEMTTNSNATTSVQEFGYNADGTVNWNALTGTQILQGAALDVQSSVNTQAGGEKAVYLTTNDGSALDNGQDKLVEACYDPSTGRQNIAFNEQVNGTNVEMYASGNGTTSVQEFGYNADGSVNWSALTGAQILQGTALDVQTSVGTQAGGEKVVYLTTNDGQALNNGQDQLVEAGYDPSSGKQNLGFNEQTNGTNVEMTANTNGTTSIQEFGKNADGTVNWSALTGTQVLQGTALDVQASMGTQANGEKNVYLTTNDGQGLNNGQDLLVEAGYDPSSGKQNLAFNEQTNGTNVEMFANTNGTTSVDEFGKNADGTVNWSALTGTQVLQGTALDVQTSVGTQASGEKVVYLTTNDGQALNNGQDTLVETGYDPSTGKQNLAFDEQTTGTNVEMTANANGTTSVQEFGKNADGSVNWSALTGTQILQGTALDVQSSIGTQSNGEKDVYLTTNDGSALNNGLDKLVEIGYDPSTGKQNLAFDEQTNGTNVEMIVNANNTTTVEDFGNNSNGTVNWNLVASITLSGVDTDVTASNSGTQTTFDNLDQPASAPITVTDGGSAPVSTTPVEPPTEPAPVTPPPPITTPPVDPLPIEPPAPIEPPPPPPPPPPENSGCEDNDPIILNLQGDKVKTVSLSGSGTYFDMQNNGQKVLTGWATAGEGMLVYDPNNTGTVTSESNLVGSFGALSDLANTSSGILDVSNPLWNSLKVWIDPTGAGNFQQGDLYSLNQLGITSINLNSTAENVNSNGNTILNDSTFTWNNGTTGDIAGVNLAFNPNLIASPTAASTSGAASDPTTSGSLNYLIQSMATFTDGSTGIAPTFSPTAANADTLQLAAAQNVKLA